MAFLLGYFGNNFQEVMPVIQKVTSDHSIEDSLITQCTQYSTVYSGKFAHEIHQHDMSIACEAHGVFVGKIFTKDTYQKKHSFDSNDYHEMIANPSLFMKKYWGRYAGAVCHPEAQKIILMRDPLGLNTIFYTKVFDGIIFSSDITLIYDCLRVKPSLHWNYFADYIIGKQYAPELTPFDGIFELQPGMGLQYHISGDLEKELLWDIAAIESAPIANKNAFEEALLDTLKKCTRAWVEDSPGVCVELSGGTDSTSVALLLSQVLREDQKLIAINYIDSKEPSSNEIEHAQEVAQMCNAKLLFSDWQDVSILDKGESSFRPNRPMSSSLFRGVDKKLREIATLHGCTDIVNGQGGDHVFLSPPPEHALADYWVQKGFSKSLGIAQELAGCYRMPISSLLWSNIKAAAQFVMSKDTQEQSFITAMPDLIVQKQTERTHYLNRFVKNFPQAKKLQIQSLAHAVAFAERNQKSPGWITSHPLLSQPVVELALQIPTYQSFDDGFDRIFFRNAVNRIKKPKALWRRMKGQTTSSMINALSAHADIFEKMVLEGSLVRSGFIEEQWICDNFAQIKHGSNENLWPIINIISVQQWLNQWGL